MPVMCIKERREACGLSQSSLALQMGLRQSAVGNWETEVALPKARDLPRLSKVLHCSIDDLFVKEQDPGSEDFPVPDYYDTPEED